MRIGLLMTGIVLTCLWAKSQSAYRMTRSEYFETYKDIAIHEMQRSGVPASITLAQGALESGDGNSSLARDANNHFGIKCHDDWNGRKIYEDDDERNECFRKYHSVEDSYRDHSDYLKAKQRYAFLFDLDPGDFRGWAKGLKKAGYATSPSYAEKLIQIIEEFGLHKYDRMDGSYQSTLPRRHHSAIWASSRPVLEKNRVKYIIAGPGDTYESLTKEFGKLEWEIPGYNDCRMGDSLTPGQVVFIQPKRNKAEAGKNIHVIRQGETMYAISQLYAVKLSRLYSMNLMNWGTRPGVGTTLQLRRALKGKQPVVEPDNTPEGGDEKDEIKVELNLE